jgi:hypothetical protein
MTVRNQKSRWTKRKILPAALVAMSGIGVAFAFIMPASADTTVVGTGITPEAATQAASVQCTQSGFDPGSVISQTDLKNGTWEVAMNCVDRTNPVPSGTVAVMRGATPEEAESNGRAECVRQGLTAGNLIGMGQLDSGEWQASVECLAS